MEWRNRGREEEKVHAGLLMEAAYLITIHSTGQVDFHTSYLVLWVSWSCAHNARMLQISQQSWWQRIRSLGIYFSSHVLMFQLVVNMHSINAVFLAGEAALNCMRFPWFRIAYFFLWTTVYVSFQWILHSLSATWWPYPFLDLSDSFSPLWYSSVALSHIPCYGVFALIMKLKHFTYLRLFPQSYQSVASF
ncbi:hypothetical protein POM88_038679 [Heracleum sosnowskyi]|uniref:Uncharacterized protein n=1 Tax=Heracleum sosnowskyi TaxID=360622 RepID=A0AAD8HBB2_9APIA|nr:hypothetical protein POM88_038679 [Heracleum sosnowskyi]